MTCIASLVALLMLLAALPAAAQSTPPAPRHGSGQAQPAPSAEPDYPTVRVGILSYLQYSAELENRDGFNAFELTRGYINITGQLSRNIRYRLTPDVRRITDGSLAGSLGFRVKYGFVQFDNLTPRSWVRLGIHQTPWIDFEESIYRYRVQGLVFAERELLLPGSGDFGAGFFTPLPRDYGEIQAGVYNGEGFGQSEVNKYKSFQGRLTIRPFPHQGLAHGLRLSGFYDLGWYDRDRPRRHGILAGSYEREHLVVMVQGVSARERPSALLTSTIRRVGYSTFVEVREGLQGWAGLLRFESFNPDEALFNDSHRRTIAGVAYWLLWSRVRVGLLVNDEVVRYDAGAARPNENRWLFQTHVEF